MFARLPLLTFSVCFTLHLGHAATPLKKAGLDRDRSSINIQSPRINKWGTWYPYKYCPAGTWVIGAQLRVASPQKDETGLDSIKLLCAPLGQIATKEEIVSYEGSSGSWKSNFYCNDAILTGFSLRSQSDQNMKDDTAASNLRLHCSDQRDVQMDGTELGDWTERQVCPIGYAVCGFRVQYQPLQPKGDKTALNNVDMACCQLTGDQCKATEQWELIKDCDNAKSNKALIYAYTQRVGMNTSIAAVGTTAEEVKRAGKITQDVGLNLQGLAKKFGVTLRGSVPKGYSWASASSQVFAPITSLTTTVTIPPHKRTKVEQFVGSCGPFKLFTPSFRFLDG